MIRIQEASDSVEVEMPSRKRYFELVLYPICLMAWGIGEVGTGNMLLSEIASKAAIDWFYVLGLLGWTAAGALIIAVWLWTACGKETLRVEKDTLTLSRRVFGIGPRWYMARSTVHRLRRVDPAPPTWWEKVFINTDRNDLFGLRRARIAFDGGVSEFRSMPQTWRIGAGINAREATRVVDTLRQYIDADQR